MGQDNSPQIEDLKKYAKSKGYNKLHIIETKESGLMDLDKKVGTNDLFQFIEKNPNYKVVFSTEISRLGRRQSVLHQIKEWFIKNNIQFYVKDINYSLFDEENKLTIAGEMMFSIYGLFSESEIQQKKDRFRRAKKSLMEQGLSISGKTLFGYNRIKLNTNSKRTTFEINKDHAKVIRTIFNWYRFGIDRNMNNTSIKKITLECMKRGFPQYTHSKRNINKLLKEEGYTGEKITNNKLKNKNFIEGGTEEKYITTNNKIKYPIIIDRETFNEVQIRLLEKNTQVEKSTKHITILSHILKCHKCKSHLNGNYRISAGENKGSYRCSSRSSAKPCGNTQSISMNLIDSSVWSLIKSNLRLLESQIKIVNPDKEKKELELSEKILQSRINEIDSQVQDVSKKISRIGNYKNINVESLFKSIDENLDKLNKEKGKIEKELSKVQMSLSLKSKIESESSYDVLSKIDVIEKSKELLKKYINLYIESIDILLHNKTITILKVNFIWSIDSMIKMSFFSKYGELGRFTYLILEKTNTNNILLYKTISPLEIIGENLISIKSKMKNGSIKKSKLEIKEFLKSKLTTKLEYTKLGVF